MALLFTASCHLRPYTCEENMHENIFQHPQLRPLLIYGYLLAQEQLVLNDEVHCTFKYYV